MKTPRVQADRVRDNTRMRFRVLACDYDGTVASQGILVPKTVAALHRLRESGHGWCW
jgi:hydroxymethylpyrimidine pyrophosphatase-like HAD family hydrolase